MNKKEKNNAKAQNELNTLNQEINAVSKEVFELTDAELLEVSGGEERRPR